MHRLLDIAGQAIKVLKNETRAYYFMIFLYPYLSSSKQQNIVVDHLFKKYNKQKKTKNYFKLCYDEITKKSKLTIKSLVIIETRNITNKRYTIIKPLWSCSFSDEINKKGKKSYLIMYALYSLITYEIRVTYNIPNDKL